MTSKFYSYSTILFLIYLVKVSSHFGLFNCHHDLKIDKDITAIAVEINFQPCLKNLARKCDDFEIITNF